MITLKALMEKVVIISDQRGNFSRDMDNIIKNQMTMTEIKNMLTKIKRAFNGFIARCDTVEERIRYSKVRIVEIIQTERQN